MNSRFFYVIQTLFFAVVGTALVFWMVQSIRIGALSWGGGTHKMEISVENMPVVFWGIVLGGTILGGTVALGNLKNVWKVLRNRMPDDK